MRRAGGAPAAGRRASLASQADPPVYPGQGPPSQEHSVPTALPLPLSDFPFLAPGGTLDVLVPPGPWRGSKMRVREEIKTRGYSSVFARVRPWASKRFSIGSVSGRREGGKWGQESDLGARGSLYNDAPILMPLPLWCHITIGQKLPRGSLQG